MDDEDNKGDEDEESMDSILAQVINYRGCRPSQTRLNQYSNLNISHDESTIIKNIILYLAVRLLKWQIIFNLICITLFLFRPNYSPAGIKW